MTKNIIFFIFLFFIGSNVLAKCASDGFWFFPCKGKLHTGEWIILEGYANSQKIINGLGTDYPVYLESDDHRVALEIKVRNQGIYSVTQAVLIPVEDLRVNETYYLRVDNLTGQESKLLRQLNTESREYEPISWLIIDKDLNDHPKWESEPVFIKSTFSELGCGIAMNANFRLHVSPGHNSYIHVELKNKSDGEINKYYILLTDTQFLSIGHGMCSGPFSFKSDETYQVRFNLVSIYGQTDHTSWSEWISIDNPWENVTR